MILAVDVAAQYPEYRGQRSRGLHRPSLQMKKRSQFGRAVAMAFIMTVTSPEGARCAKGKPTEPITERGFSFAAVPPYYEESRALHSGDDGHAEHLADGGKTELGA